MTRIGTAAAHFGRDLEASLDRIASLIDNARDAGAELLALPHAALGGYLGDLRDPDPDSLPPALVADDPIFARIGRLAGDLVVCLGYTERDRDGQYAAAVCLHGDGVLGRHRKVHQPPGEAAHYLPGSRFDAFDTPVGRVGMLIDYDKTFPESSRSLAVDGAQILACLSAWPASVTMRASSLVNDRQTRLFDMYDVTRAAENQVVLVSANQTGATGGLRFLGHAKVVDPAGQILVRTGAKAGLVVAEIDVAAAIERSRRVLHHLRERRLDAYLHTTRKPDAPDGARWRDPAEEA